MYFDMYNAILIVCIIIHYIEGLKIYTHTLEYIYIYIYKYINGF